MRLIFEFMVDNVNETLPSSIFVKPEKIPKTPGSRKGKGKRLIAELGEAKVMKGVPLNTINT